MEYDLTLDKNAIAHSSGSNMLGIQAHASKSRKTNREEVGIPASWEILKVLRNI